MVWEDLIFVDQNTDSLFEHGAFLSKYVSKVSERFDLYFAYQLSHLERTLKSTIRIKFQ